MLWDLIFCNSNLTWLTTSSSNINCSTSSDELLVSRNMTLITFCGDGDAEDVITTSVENTHIWSQPSSDSFSYQNSLSRLRNQRKFMSCRLCNMMNHITNHTFHRTKPQTPINSNPKKGLAIPQNKCKASINLSVILQKQPPLVVLHTHKQCH